jgi:hypothetical protein
MKTLIRISGSLLIMLERGRVSFCRDITRHTRVYLMVYRFQSSSHTLHLVSTRQIWAVKQDAHFHLSSTLIRKHQLNKLVIYLCITFVQKVQKLGVCLLPLHRNAGYKTLKDIPENLIFLFLKSAIVG